MGEISSHPRRKKLWVDIYSGFTMKSGGFPVLSPHPVANLDDATMVVYGLLRAYGSEFVVGWDYDSKIPAVYFKDTGIGIVASGQDPNTKLASLLRRLHDTKGLNVTAVHTDAAPRRYLWPYVVPAIVPVLHVVQGPELAQLRRSYTGLEKNKKVEWQLLDAMLLSEMPVGVAHEQFARRKMVNHRPTMFNLTCMALLNDTLFHSRRKIEGEQNVYEVGGSIDEDFRIKHQEILHRLGLLTLQADFPDISLRRLITLAAFITPDMALNDIRSYLFSRIRRPLREFFVQRVHKPWEKYPPAAAILRALYPRIYDLTTTYKSGLNDDEILGLSVRLNHERKTEWSNPVHVRLIQKILDVDLTSPPQQVSPSSRTESLPVGETPATSDLTSPHSNPHRPQGP